MDDEKKNKSVRMKWSEKECSILYKVLVQNYDLYKSGSLKGATKRGKTPKQEVLQMIVDQMIAEFTTTDKDASNIYEKIRSDERKIRMRISIEVG